MNVPKFYWGEAVLTSAYLINRLPSRVLSGVSPVQAMTSFFPSVPIMSCLQSHVFGCSAFVHVHSPHRGKLDPRDIKCVFIGYAPDKKGYKCYHPSSRRVYISMDVTFQEIESFYLSSQLQGENSQEAESPELPVLPLVLPLPQEPLMPSSIPTTEDTNEDNGGDDNHGPEPIAVQNNDDRCRIKFQRKVRKVKPVLVQQQVQSSEPEVSTLNPEPSSSCEPNLDDLPIALRKEKRSCAKYPISQFVSTQNLSVQHQSFISAIDSIRVPTSVQEALNYKSCIQAMNEEMHALEKNGTWEIVEKPNDKRTVGCRWIYTVKYRSDGTLE